MRCSVLRRSALRRLQQRPAGGVWPSLQQATAITTRHRFHRGQQSQATAAPGSQQPPVRGVAAGAAPATAAGAAAPLAGVTERLGELPPRIAAHQQKCIAQMLRGLAEELSPDAVARLGGRPSARIKLHDPRCAFVIERALPATSAAPLPSRAGPGPAPMPKYSALHLGSMQLLPARGASAFSATLPLFLDHCAPLCGGSMLLLPMDAAAQSFASNFAAKRQNIAIAPPIDALVRAIKSDSQSAALFRSSGGLFSIRRVGELFAHLHQCHPQWGRLNLSEAEKRESMSEVKQPGPPQKEQNIAAARATVENAGVSGNSAPVLHRAAAVSYLGSIFRDEMRVAAEMVAARGLLNDCVCLVAAPATVSPPSPQTQPSHLHLHVLSGLGQGESLERRGGTDANTSPAATATPIPSIADHFGEGGSGHASARVAFVGSGVKELLRQLPDRDWRFITSAEHHNRFRYWCTEYAEYLAGAQRPPATSPSPAPSKKRVGMAPTAVMSGALATGARFAQQVRAAASTSSLLSVQHRMESLLATAMMEASGLHVCSTRALRELESEFERGASEARAELLSILAAHLPFSSPSVLDKWKWTVSRHIASLIFGGCIASAICDSYGALLPCAVKKSVPVATAPPPPEAAAAATMAAIATVRLADLRAALAADAALMRARCLFVAAMMQTSSDARAALVSKALQSGGEEGVALRRVVRQQHGVPASSTAAVGTGCDSSEVELLASAAAAAAAASIPNTTATSPPLATETASARDVRGVHGDDELQRLAHAVASPPATIVYSVRLRATTAEHKLRPTLLQVHRFTNGEAETSPLFSAPIVHDTSVVRPADRPWSLALHECATAVSRDVQAQISAQPRDAQPIGTVVLFAVVPAVRELLFAETMRHVLGMPVVVASPAALRRASADVLDDFAALRHSGDDSDAIHDAPTAPTELLAQLGNTVGGPLEPLLQYNGCHDHPATHGGRAGTSTTAALPLLLSGLPGLAQASLLSCADVDALRAKCTSASGAVQVNERTLSIIAEAAQSALSSAKAEAMATTTNAAATSEGPLGAPSEVVLQAERVAATQAIINVRTCLRKLRSLEKDAQLVSKGSSNFVIGPDSRIHHRLLHTSTATGRLSSRNPNAQSIPKTSVRRMFTSRFGRDQGSIIEADYSQLEVVVLALLSGDKTMIGDLVSQVDFHCKRVALLRPDLTYDEIVHRAKVRRDPEIVQLRQQAKAFSFQRQYGAGAKQIAESTGLSIATVTEMMAAEDRLYDGVARFFDVAHTCVMQGAPLFDSAPELRTLPKALVTPAALRVTDAKLVRAPLPAHFFATFSGTRYNLYDARGSGGRRAPVLLNYPVQGFAGELVLLVLGKLFRHFASNDNYSGRAVLINTVHDSVWVDAHNDVLEEVVADLRGIMEGIPRYVEETWPGTAAGSVPFPVTISSGPTLFDQREHVSKSV